MRLVVTGGGTGGHIYPALAIAEAMKAGPDAEAVVYIGKAGGLESEIVPQNGIDFEGIAFTGMPRSKSPLLPFKLLRWAWQLRQAVQVAKQKLQTIRPDMVFGTGGYVSAPVLLAARQLKIPYVVHEADAEPGLANRFMAKGAAAITTSFSEGAERLRQRPDQQVLVTGNPIRGTIGQLDKTRALRELGLDWPAERPLLLVTGGSQGARRLNKAVVEALPALLNEAGWSVIHLSGKKLFEETGQALEAQASGLRNHPNYKLLPFSAQMAALLGAADMAVCRAGSLSLSEMYVCGIPTILVPYPYAAADHQRKNARASAKAGASLMIEDSELDGHRLLDELLPLLQHPERREAMRQAALSLGHPNATAEIVACIRNLVAQKSHKQD